ncbi:glycosyltransferase [Acaryochloris marina]|uniref:glycosyltransferase n=1 Tax=Acaryochloris marina TaxID=155978 RepID=UPI001BB05A66|nr:glycosyltransferase [Acaryochloris marina]QUY44999.1 glycosyltransferase [Acaryochloris marina S15]
MNEENKKIVFLITSLEYGGAQTQLIPLAFELKKLGWEILVVSMRTPEAFVEDLNKAAISVASLDMPKGIPDPRAILKLVRILKDFKPQILNSHMFHANLLARITRLLVKVPVLISTAHNVNEKSSAQDQLDKASWFEIAYRLTDPLSNLTTTICQAGVDRYVHVKAVPSEKILFIPNSVDTRRFYPDRSVRELVRTSLGIENQFCWLAIGRLELQKDYPTMLSAFSILVNQYPDTQLLICGTGSLQDEIENLVFSLKLERNVKLLGVRKDIPQLMNSVDGYVMSSAWEGMPIVLLEASATGLPIVSTNVGGNSEVVIHGQNGFLVPPHDDRALALQMSELMALTPNQHNNMSKAGTNHILNKHQLDKLSNQWNSLYEKTFEEVTNL